MSIPQDQIAWLSNNPERCATTLVCCRRVLGYFSCLWHLQWGRGESIFFSKGKAVFRIFEQQQLPRHCRPDFLERFSRLNRRLYK